MPNKASKEKYQWLISKREKQGINHFNDSKPSMISMIFIKRLKNTIPAKNEKF